MNETSPMKSTKKPKDIITVLLRLALAVIVGLIALRSLNLSAKADQQMIDEHTITYTNGDYLYLPEKENIALDEETMTLYYSNVLDVYPVRQLSEEEIQNIEELLNGRIAGKISGSANLLRFRIPDYELNELDAIRANLYSTGNILMASACVPDELLLQIDETEEVDENNGDWWIDAIGMQEAWKYEAFSHPHNTGIIDSGVNSFHPILNPIRRSGMILLNDNTPEDHGTFVTSLVAANDDNNFDFRGIDRSSRLYLADISDGERMLTTPEVLALDQQMIEEECKVINHSFGHTLASPEHYRESPFTAELAEELGVAADEVTYDQYLQAYASLRERSAETYISWLAEMMMHDNAFLIVQTAGNGYDNNGPGYSLDEFGIGFRGITEEFYNNWLHSSAGIIYGENYEDLLSAHHISFKTMMDHIIVVGAADHKRDEEKRYIAASFSNYGSNVDIYAPGVSIRSAEGENTVAVHNGTSYSAPLITGTASYLWSIKEEKNSAEIKTMLQTGNYRVIADNTEYPMLNAEAVIISAVKGIVNLQLADENSNPIDNASISYTSEITDHNAFNDSTSSYDGGEVLLPAIGQMHIQIQCDGYEPAEIDCYVSAGEEIDLGTIILTSASTETVSRYQFFSIEVCRSWEEAEEYCEYLGGHLAVINSPEEDHLLYELMKQNGYDSAYFGLTDAGHEGEWIWIDGTPLTYTNWYTDEPNNEYGDENYGMYYWQFEDGRWNDGDFGGDTYLGGKAFICEWEESE